MKMLHDNVLVRKLNKKQTGTVLLPESVQDDWLRGEVVTIGPGRRNMAGELIPLDIKVDDIVLYPPSIGGDYPHVSVDGEELYILPGNSIWGIE